MFNLKGINDVTLTAHIASQLASLEHIGHNPQLAVLGIELVRRVLQVGFTDGYLNDHCCFFSTGIEESEVSDWICDNLELDYSGLISLQHIPHVFDIMDPDINTLPRLDLRTLLKLEYIKEDDIPLITGHIEGIEPLCPYSGSVYRDGYLVATQDDTVFLELEIDLDPDDMDAVFFC
jgi:hypothetical protein